MKSFFILISRFATPPRCVLAAGPGLMLLHQKREKESKKSSSKLVIYHFCLPVAIPTSWCVPSSVPASLSHTLTLRAAPVSRLVSSGSVSPARQLLCFPCVFRGMLRIFSSNFITIFTWHICSHFDLAKAKIYLAAAAPATIITTADAASLPLSFDLVLCVLWACQCVVPRASCVIKTH